MNLKRFAQSTLLMLTIPLSGQAQQAASAQKADSNEQELSAVRQQLSANAAQGVKSQQVINGIDEETQQLLQQYRTTNTETDQLRLYNKQMKQIVASQQAELAKIDQQIKDIEFTERGILPLMDHMLSSLKQFIALDLPFLQKERQTRLVNLELLLGRADITISEKYRRTLEAFQIEIDYGRTLEAYREQGEDQLVYDYLRIGRTALYRVAINGDQAWSWSKKQQDWLDVDSGLMRNVRKALDVARQTAAPELLLLPVPTSKDNPGA